ncbi:MAG: hypothetical protein P8X96_23180 [Desulfobacteraceae bacterium]
MNQSRDRILDRQSLIEDLLRDKLINNILIMTTLYGIIVFAMTQVRAREIGWTVRDLIYLIILVSGIIITLKRKKIKAQHKAILIIILYLIIGVVGCYTFGMLAGSAFFFPMSAVILALFYAARTVVVFNLISIGFLCSTAVGFSTTYLRLRVDANILITNYSHWSVYILSVIFFFLISSVTIINYRRAMNNLIKNVNSQRDKIERTKNDLQKALDEIRTLRGILPLCSFCKKIRDDKGYWEQVDVYIQKHSEADISHSVCPECMKVHYPKSYASLLSKKKIAEPDG